MTSWRARRAWLNTSALVGAIAVGSAGAPAVAGQAAASDNHSYDIQSEPLSDALRDYGQASGRQLIYTEDLVRGRTAPALIGTYSARAALLRLLEGSGLGAQLSPSGAVMIVKMRPNAAAPNHPPAQAIAGSADPAPTAQAQPISAAVPEVIVTARRTAENIQKVPIAVTAITPETMQDQQINTQEDLQFHVPSLQVGTNIESALQGSYTLRSIPGVVSYYAEVPGGPSGPGYPYFDISSVQVLNGPQGTLFGRSSVGGAILIDPAQPDLTKTSGFVDLQAGNLDLNRETAVINLPIIDDQLGVRIALNRNYEEGYVQQLGTGNRFNETNNWSARVSVLWKPGDGKFSDYAVFDYMGVDESPDAVQEAIVDPSQGYFAIPASSYSAQLAAPCAAAVSAGLASSASYCVAQRSAYLASLLPAALAEQARLRSGGSNALNYVAGPPPGDGGPFEPYAQTLAQTFFSNKAQYDFGDLGFTTLTLSDIFGLQTQSGQGGWEVDGLGGAIESATGFLPFNDNFGGSGTPCSQQQNHFNAPATISYCPASTAYGYSDEVRANGVAFAGLLTWQVGGYFENDPSPTGANSTAGTNAAVDANEGVFSPNWGWEPVADESEGGASTEQAVYTQETVDLSRLTPFIAGLHVTGGVRYTWDKSAQNLDALITNPVTGAWTQGAHVAGGANCGGYSYCTSSEGLNYTLAVDAQIRPDWMLYVSTNKAYVPGGLNTRLLAAGAPPGYVSTYLPETVIDYEVGSKATFSLGDFHFLQNTAIYSMNFNNIFVTDEGGVPPTLFTTNAAAAQINGVELTGELIWHNWDISGSYTYTDARYTKFLSSDPLGVQTTPGSSYCSPPLSSTECLLNLAYNTVPDAPKDQLNVNVEYTLPLSDNRGNVKFTATAYYQTRIVFESDTDETVRLFGPQLGYSNLLNALSQAPYQLYNLNLEWKHVYGSQIDVGAFVDNLTDTRYKTYGGTLTWSEGYAPAIYSPPTTYGLEFHYQF